MGTSIMTLKICSKLTHLMFLSYYSKLDPRLSEAEELDLIRTSVDCIYPLPPDGLPAKKNKEESYEKTLEIEVLMQATFEALHDLLKEMLLKDLTPNGLNTIFKVMYCYLM